MKYKICDNIVFREEGSEGLLFNRDTCQLKVLNGTAKIIWQAIDGGADAEVILSAMQKEFSSVDQKTIQDDFEGFIKTLLEQKYIEAP